MTNYIAWYYITDDAGKKLKEVNYHVSLLATNVVREAREKIRAILTSQCLEEFGKGSEGKRPIINIIRFEKMPGKK